MHEGRSINGAVMGREKTEQEKAEINYLANPTSLKALSMRHDQIFGGNEDEYYKINPFTGF